MAEAALSKRERQIMDIVFQAGEISAADVHARLPEAPTYTAVRTMLRLLEDKGFLQHRLEGRKYIYSACKSPTVAGRSAMQRVLDVFFGGSLEDAVAAHLSDPGMHFEPGELDRLRAVIEEARQETPPQARPGETKKTQETKKAKKAKHARKRR